MNNFMSNLLGASWRTSSGAIIAALPQLLNGAAAAAGVTLNHWVMFGSFFVSAAGILVIGLSSKDAVVHSTEAQVATASANQAPPPQAKG